METSRVESGAMPTDPPAERRGERFVRWGLPLATLAFFLATAKGYGVFRDELYYVACGRHLAFGYVDHPPMVALLAALVRTVAGDSYLALRALSALAFATTVLLAGDTARRMGGGTWARLLTQLLVGTTPIYLSIFSIFSMNGFDVLAWAALARLAATLLDGGPPRLWLAFGVVAGLGLETKLDVGLLGVGLAAGALLARRFDLLRVRELWLGAVIAALLFLPHVAWQVVHDFPTREFVAHAQEGKIALLGPLGFVAAQPKMVGPVAAAAALAGLGWLLAAPAARAWRPIGWAALFALGVFAFSVSKPYYFSPAYTLLFPAAGVALERWTAGRPALLSRAGRALLPVAVLFTLVFAPLAKPLLSEERYLRYAAALGVEPGSDERHRLGRLPQFFADMHGWRELAEAVGRVAAALPPEERLRACVFGQNYGEAGAIDFFRSEFHLPPALSGHNNYWLWGPGSCTGEVVIVLGGDPGDLERQFASHALAGKFDCADCMPYEDQRQIWVARGLKVPIAQVWPATRHYD